MTGAHLGSYLLICDAYLKSNLGARTRTYTGRWIGNFERCRCLASRNPYSYWYLRSRRFSSGRPISVELGVRDLETPKKWHHHFLRRPTTHPTLRLVCVCAQLWGTHQESPMNYEPLLLNLKSHSFCPFNSLAPPFLCSHLSPSILDSLLPK